MGPVTGEAMPGTGAVAGRSPVGFATPHVARCCWGRSTMRMFHRALPRFGLLAVATIAALATAAGSAAAVETADEPSSDLLVSVMPDPVLITGVTPMTVDVGIGLGSVPRDAALILDISRLHGVDVLLGSTGCTRERTRITCTWPGQTFPFVTGRQLVFPLRRTHNAQAGPAGTVTATVRSASPDPEPGNNTQTVAVAIADTGVGLVASVGPTETPYTFGFTLPTGTQFVSAPDICAPVSPSEYRCTPAEPASAGGPAFFGTLILRITEPSVGADGAFTVTGEAVDPDLSNNTGPIQITVTA